MRIIIFGSGEFAVPTFDSIRHDGHDVPLVVSQPDKPGGRGKHPLPTPLKAAAVADGVPVVTPADVNAPDMIDLIRSQGADLGYVAAFGQKLGPTLLHDIFPAGMVNLHGSILPAYRGAAPIQWAVINGDLVSGVSVFRIVECMDAGPVLITRQTAIGMDETADELHDRLARIGCDAVRETLKMLSADPKSPGIPQDESAATRAPKLKKSDGHIHFDMPARALAARINGLWSWPGAVCRFVAQDGSRDEQVTLVRARPYEGPMSAAGSNAELGRVDAAYAIQARDGAISVLEIQPAGRKRMAWPDFVNGRRVVPGDRFVPLEPAL